MTEDEKAAQRQESLIQLAAQKAATRGGLLASALQSFRQLENLDEAGLAAYLKIAPNQLTRMALCARPDPANSQTFVRDCRLISEKFELAPTQLLNLLRRVAAYEANQAGSIRRPMLAARDYDEANQPAADKQDE